MSGFRRMFRLPLLPRHDVKKDVEEELSFHVAMRETKLRAGGLDGDEAARVARERFGDMQAIKGECVRESERLARREHMMRVLEDAAQDTRYAIRSLFRARRFTLAVVLTLALGIGVNVTVFSLIDAVVLRPVTGVTAVEDVFELSDPVSYPVFQGVREAVPALGVAAVSSRPFAIPAGDVTEMVAGDLVSGSFFRTMGVRVALGRALTEADDVEGGPAVAVLSHAFWTRRFAADPGVLGSAIEVNGATVTVVGIAAPEFRGLHVTDRPALWLPIGVWRLLAPTSMREARMSDPGWEWATMLGRKPRGMSVENVRAAVIAAWRAVDPEAPAEDVATRATPRPAQAAALPIPARSAAVRFSAILLGVVLLVLLAACANITGLLLARAAHRRPEMGVRVACGAGRWRLARQLLTEAMVLAGAGGLAGLAVFTGAKAALSRVTLPGGLLGTTVAPALDTRLLVFAAALTAVTGVTIGLAPVLQLRGSVKPGGGAVGRSQLFGNLLVSAQVAVAVALLLGTGYFARALGRALDVETGFDADRVVMVGMNTDLVQRGREETVALREAAVQRVAALPGVTAVSWTGNIPLTASFDRQRSVVEGYTPAEGERVRFEYVGVGPRYHEVLGIPILRGRGFDERDLGPGQRVAVINQTAADRYFGGRDPLGLTIRMGEETLRVVGVAGDALYHALGEEPRPYLYFPLSDMRQDVVLARVERDAAALVPELEQAVRSATPGVPVIAFGTLNDRLHAVLAPQVSGAWLLGAFGALALIIALVGIYGVLAYSVERRTREIGIRIAIGARAADVVRSVVLRGATLVSLGVVGGLVLGVLLGRGARSFLFGVPASDPVTLATTSGIMLLVGVVATWVPARRAVGVDPSTALRADA